MLDTTEIPRKTMAEDWASRFMPSTEEEIKPDNVVVEHTEETVPEKDESIRLSDQVLMSALDILRNDVQRGDAEIKEFILSVVELLGHYGNRFDEVEGLIVRKFGQIESMLLQPPPVPMTNVFDEFPEMIDDIRKEAESEAEMPEIPGVPSEGGDFSNPDYVEPVEAKMVIEDEVVSHTIHQKFYDAYEDWRNPDAEGSWQSFVKVCGGPVKAKEYRELIESNLPPSDDNTSP